MARKIRQSRRRQARYRRARIRSFVFTTGPDRLSGGRIARRHLADGIRVRAIEASSPVWPEGFDGLRIGHVSDFHLGELIPLDRGLEAVRRLAEQEPDFVACTGDVVDLHHDLAGPLLEALAGVEAPLGTALVLGNHDELHCPDTIMRLAADAGVMALHDDAAAIRRRGEELIVAGIGWSRSTEGCGRRVDVAGGSEADVLLSHSPKAFGRAAELGIPLTLAGHTHGGQIAMKRRRRVNSAPVRRYRAGLYERGASRLHVTAGVGAWFPLRLNCPAEVAVITMRKSPGS